MNSVSIQTKDSVMYPPRLNPAEFIKAYNQHGNTSTIFHLNTLWSICIQAIKLQVSLGHQ